MIEVAMEILSISRTEAQVLMVFSSFGTSFAILVWIELIKRVIQP